MVYCGTSNTTRRYSLRQTASDVETERTALTDAVNIWNAQAGHGLNVRIELVRWESHAIPDMSMAPQKAINTQLVEDCDLGIAIFWYRIGTPTTNHSSGSAEEISQLVDRGVRVLMYFCSRPVPQASLIDDQFAKLQVLKKRYREQGLVSEYSDVNGLREQVLMHLTAVVTQLSKALPPVSSLGVAIPDIRVQAHPGILKRAHHALGESERALLVEIQNHSAGTVYLDKVSLELKSGDLLFVLQEVATCELQHRRELHSGQKYTVHIDPEQIRAHVAELVCVEVKDDII